MKVTRKDIADAFDKGHLTAFQMSYPLNWYEWVNGIVTLVPKKPLPNFKFCDDPDAEQAWWDSWTKE
jgi:hypothetical protein